MRGRQKKYLSLGCYSPFQPVPSLAPVSLCASFLCILCIGGGAMEDSGYLTLYAWLGYFHAIETVPGKG